MRAVVEDYTPPHNLEAEISALGSMMLSERAADELVLLLNEEDFYRPAHREIFKVMKYLLMHSRAVDLVTVKNELLERELLETVGGVDYLIQLAESVPSPSNAAHYGEIVLDKATLRRLENAGHDIVQLVHDPESDAEEKVDKAEQLVFEVGQKRLGKDFAPVKSLAKEFFDDVDRIMETGEPLLGTSSGFPDLDKMTGGFYESDFTIVAARPSMGKTSLVLNFALNVARKRPDENVAVFSLEMSGKQVVRRMMSMLSGVSMGALKKSRLGDDEYQRLADACEVLYSLPIYVDDSSDVSPLEMRGKCRRLKQDGGLSMVIVDYLQLMRSSRKTENRVQEISEIARSLKALAKELNVPVIALSQLNRGVESREDKRPQLSDIRESGSIEAEADLVMFIYRESYYKSKDAEWVENYDPKVADAAEIIISKHRNGPTGKVILGFQASCANFITLDHGSIEDYLASLKRAG